MNDFSSLRLDNSSELFNYPEVFAQESEILNKTYLWLINRPPGSVYNIEELAPEKREVFIKIACCFILEGHTWISFNQTFTRLSSEPIYYESASKFFINITRKRIKEQLLMNDNQIIVSPKTKQYIRVGRVIDGNLNVITSFNPIEAGLNLSLKNIIGVGRIKGMYTYDDGSGGIAISVNEEFKYVSFIEQLTELFIKIETKIS